MEATQFGRLHEMMPLKKDRIPSVGKPAIWLRVLIAGFMLISTAVAGWCVWIFGILMFTFSLDGANSQRLPDWLDAFMLVGWPISIALVAIIPSALVAFGAKRSWVIAAFLGTSFWAFGVYLIGVVSVLSSLQ